MTGHRLFSTAFGWSGIVWTDAGIRRSLLPVAEESIALEQLGAGCASSENTPLSHDALEAERWIKQYFGGDIRQIRFRLDMSDLSEWQRRACEAMLEIPVGEVRTYRWLAEALGKPRAARAAGMACARNPLPVIVPCHRIVASSGNLGGFAGGLELKQKMLDIERGRI